MAIFFQGMSQKLYDKWIDTFDDILEQETGTRMKRCECPCQCYVVSRLLDEDQLCYRCVTGKHPGRASTEGKRYVKARTVRRFTAGKR